MSVNPAETTVVAPPQPAAPSSTESQSDQPALFKKAGGDWNKANKSYFDLVNEFQRVQGVAQTAEQLSQRNSQLETALGSLLGGGDGGQPASTDPLAPIQDELGLPIEPFRRGMRAEALAVMEELFGPVIAEHTAAEALSGEIENFPQLQAEARRYMHENSEAAEVFNAVRKTNPSAAWKYAIRESLIAKGGRLPEAPNVQHAGLPSGMNAGGRVAASPDGAVSQQVRESEALKYAYEFGDNAPYRHERFKGTSIERAVRAAMQNAGLTPPPEGGTPQGW